MSKQGRYIHIFLFSYFFPDQEEFVYLLNLIKSKRVKNVWPDLGEQGWLNEVYLWEKFDIGHEYNMCASYLNLGMYKLLDNTNTIFHFAGPEFKPDKCQMKKPLKTLCNKWKNYTLRLQ